jgi:hypothetical protein
MTIDFELNDIQTTEFGVGQDTDAGQTFSLVPVDANVQQALREMVSATWTAMQKNDPSPSRYEPAEKHAGTEHLFLPIDDDLAKSMRELHLANNLLSNSAALNAPLDVFCYFVKLTDGAGRRLTALRRANQFKGILRSRLIQLFTDALKLVEHNVFKLDNDFDVLVDAGAVHILRPSGFEFAGRLQEAVLAAVSGNVQKIQKALSFVDFSSVETYAQTRPRAARYLASIQADQTTKNIDKAALAKFCKSNDVPVKTAKGKLVVPEDRMMDFLEVLDKRRYEVKLTKSASEKFRATGRQRIS